MNYRVRYEYLGPRWQPRTKDFESSNPVGALNQFHEFCQRTMFHGKRLKPAEYRILSFCQFYHSATLHREPGMTPIIESVIDLPKSENPDLSGIKMKPNCVDVEFKF